MKTAKLIVLALLITVTTFFYGCGTGKMEATISPTLTGGLKYDSKGVGLIPSPSSIELGETYRRMKQADMLERMMAGLKQGKTIEADSGRYIIALINNDSSQKVYCYHPEIPGWQIIADPKGGFGFMQVRDIPYEIPIYRSDGKIIHKSTPRYSSDFAEKISHKKLVGNVLADWKITINKVY